MVKYIFFLLSRYSPRLDTLYPSGLALVVKSENFTITHLQRHLRIGYKRACRMMAQIEKDIAHTPKTINVKTKEWV